MCACNGYYDDFIKNLITFSAVREITLLLNTILFHPVHAAWTYGYITLVSFQRKTYLSVIKRMWKIYLGEKYVQARAFWRNGSYAPGSNVHFKKNTENKPFCVFIYITTIMLDQNKKYTGCATTLVSVSKGLFRPGAPTSCPTHEHMFIHASIKWQVALWSPHSNWEQTTRFQLNQPLVNHDLWMVSVLDINFVSEKKDMLRICHMIHKITNNSTKKFRGNSPNLTNIVWVYPENIHTKFEANHAVVWDKTSLYTFHFQKELLFNYLVHKFTYTNRYNISKIN